MGKKADKLQNRIDIFNAKQRAEFSAALRVLADGKGAKLIVGGKTIDVVVTGFEVVQYSSGIIDYKVTAHLNPPNTILGG